MALTVARDIALFQILRCPYSLSAGVLSDTGLSVEPTTVAAVSTDVQTKTAIQAYVAALSADVLTELTTLLDRWIALGTDCTSIDGGSVESIAGLTDNPDKERQVIRDMVITIVPYYRKADELRSRLEAHRWLENQV